MAGSGSFQWQKARGMENMHYNIRSSAFETWLSASLDLRLVFPAHLVLVPVVQVKFPIAFFGLDDSLIP